MKRKPEVTFSEAKAALERTEAGLASAAALKKETKRQRAESFDARNDGTGSEDDYQAAVRVDLDADAAIVEWKDAVERRKAELDEVIIADRKRNEALAHRKFVTLAKRREDAFAGIDEAERFRSEKYNAAWKANREMAAFVGRDNVNGMLMGDADLAWIGRLAAARVGPGPALLGGQAKADGPPPLDGAASRPDIDLQKLRGLGGLDSRGIAATTNAAAERRRFSSPAPEPQPVNVAIETNAAGRGAAAILDGIAQTPDVTPVTIRRTGFDPADVLPNIEPDSPEYLAFLKSQGALTQPASSIPLPTKVTMK